jgi:hypothetical protein
MDFASQMRRVVEEVRVGHWGSQSSGIDLGLPVLPRYVYTRLSYFEGDNRAIFPAVKLYALLNL